MSALGVLIIGGSGNGKTYSLKGFNDKPDAIGVLAVEKSRLPFKSNIKVVKVPDTFKEAKTAAQVSAARYGWIQMVIANSKCKTLVIDDSQYLMANEMFERAKETGYGKFTDIAVNFRNLIHFVNTLPDDNKIVYFLHHTEEGVEGKEKAKTVGKMIDEKLVLEGCFDIVLYCKDQKFYTQANGMSTAKSPEGLFDSLEIPNDLRAVDTAIREYYGMEAL